MHFSRLTYPTYYVTKGVLVIIAAIYMLLSLFLPIWHYEDDYYLAYLLPFLVLLFASDGFRRVTLLVDFDDTLKQLHVEYLTWFFARRSKEIDYANLCFLSYNMFKPLTKSKMGDGVTEVRMYDQKKYVCRLTVSLTGWTPEVIDTVDAKLGECALKKYKLSPGLL